MYFIKLFTDLLDDRKKMMLPDNLWRRLIELSLIAADYDKGGMLPCLDEIRWKLRFRDETLESEIKELTERGFLEEMPDDELGIAEYERLTGPVSDNERRKQSYRKKKQEDKLMDTRRRNVPKLSRKVTNHATDYIDSLDKKDDKEESHACTREADAKFQDIMNLWSNNVTLSVAPITADEMKMPEYLDLPLPYWVEAVEIACANNARKWSYIRAILDKSIRLNMSPVAANEYEKEQNKSKGHRNGQYSNKADQPPPAIQLSDAAKAEAKRLADADRAAKASGP